MRPQRRRAARPRGRVPREPHESGPPRRDHSLPRPPTARTDARDAQHAVSAALRRVFPSADRPATRRPAHHLRTVDAAGLRCRAARPQSGVSLHRASASWAARWRWVGRCRCRRLRRPPWCDSARPGRPSRGRPRRPDEDRAGELPGPRGVGERSEQEPADDDFEGSTRPIPPSGPAGLLPARAVVCQAARGGGVSLRWSSSSSRSARPTRSTVVEASMAP